MRFIRQSDGREIADRVLMADSMLGRMKGLLGKSHFAAGEALWIRPCNSIHMFFMKFAIDAIFLDGEEKVVALYPEIKPWRMTRIHFGASSVLEVNSGVIGKIGLGIGDRLQAVE